MGRVLLFFMAWSYGGMILWFSVVQAYLEEEEVH